MPEKDGGYFCKCPNPLNYGPTCNLKRNPCDLSPCLNGGTCKNLNDTAFNCSCPSPYFGHKCQNVPVHDCDDVYTLANKTKPGVYTVTVNGKPVDVYCADGWTFIQRRIDGFSFAQGYAAYQRGFGDKKGSHWLGLSTIHDLTKNNNKSYSLRVNMSNCENLYKNEDYATFEVGNATTSFKLHVGGSASGTAGDSLRMNLYPNNDQPFTTYDHRDARQPSDCRDIGGWWFYTCHITFSNLNNKWISNCNGENYKSVFWYTYNSNFQYTMYSTEMKIKPNI